MKIVIIGGGPTGLGAATRLEQHGGAAGDWLLLERNAGPAGLATTDVTPEGFLFDIGGHVIFSHYEYFDALLDRAVGAGGWNVHERVSYVRIKGRFVPYPFQNNISCLDEDDKVACLRGLVEAKVENATAAEKPKDFDEWILRCMGKGIADLFMRPYNFKVWACPPSEMQCSWLGERVATVDVGRAVANVVRGEEDAGWGPNATFRFPRRGGTGAIWKGVAALLPPEKQMYGADVVGVDLDARAVTLADGAKVGYDRLVSTAPLDVFCRWIGRDDWADRLVYSSTHVVGIGVRGACPHGKKCWLYFPEPDCPFYRATVFSNYSDGNVPGPGRALPTLCRGDLSGASSAEAREGPYWSLMFEVSESRRWKPVDTTPVRVGDADYPKVVAETILGAVRTELLSSADEVVSVYHRRLEHGYPTPSLDRDAVLAEALPYLRGRGVWSRGRFGAYRYEVGNQDHSLMLGVECADNILFGSEEMTLNHPNVVNAKKNTSYAYP
jgi:protoporphyrinogen oxidase